MGQSGGDWEEKEEEARVLGCASASCRGHGAGGEGDPAVVVASEEKATVGRSHALLVTVRRWKEGCGLAGPARHWGGRWAERPASPSTFSFSILFLFFCRERKGEKRIGILGLFNSEIFLLNCKTSEPKVC